MFGGTVGYFRLDSWILANIVQLGTQRFCRQFLNRTNDPCGRQYDQMTQAARSGCANIAEGSARGTTSRETEMKLTDVARSSLAELSGDYLNWLLQQGKTPWAKDSPEARAVYGVRLDAPGTAGTSCTTRAPISWRSSGSSPGGWSPGMTKSWPIACCFSSPG